MASFVAMTVVELGGHALMVIGAAACAWLPLSLIKPMAKRRVLLGMCVTLGLATAGVKMFTGSSPRSASAAAPASPSQEELLATDTGAATTQPAAVVVITKPAETSGARKDDKPQQLAMGDTRPQDPKNVAIKPVAIKASAERELGDPHTDHTNGYSIRFPTAWASKQFGGGDPWFIEVSDGKTGLISVGFSPFPATAGIDQLYPNKLAAHLGAQKHTTVEAKGYGTIDGQPCAWFKYSGPIKGALGEQPMTVIHYFVPMHDGRMFELRMAAVPDAFAKMAPILKKCAASVKLLPA